MIAALNSKVKEIYAHPPADGDLLPVGWGGAPRALGMSEGGGKNSNLLLILWVVYENPNWKSVYRDRYTPL